MQNHLMELLAAGKVALGAQLRFGAPAMAELLARAGFDFASIDAEHAPQTPMGIQAQLPAVQGTHWTPIVRFGRNDADEIRLALDMGAGGVLIPLVRTAEAIENIDGILAVEGLDSFVMGPADQSIALGVPLDTLHPRVAQATETVLASGDEWRLPDAYD